MGGDGDFGASLFKDSPDCVIREKSDDLYIVFMCAYDLMNVTQVLVCVLMNLMIVFRCNDLKGLFSKHF